MLIEKRHPAPPPCHQAAGGSFAGVDVPVCSHHTKSDTPEASNDSEEEDKMKIVNDTPNNETNKEGADLDGGSDAKSQEEGAELDGGSDAENQKEEGAELDVGSNVGIQVKDSKDDGKKSHYSLLPIHQHSHF